MPTALAHRIANERERRDLARPHILRAKEPVPRGLRAAATRGLRSRCAKAVTDFKRQHGTNCFLVRLRLDKPLSARLLLVAAALVMRNAPRPRVLGEAGAVCATSEDMTHTPSPKSTWFLVARRSGATIFSNYGRGTALQIVAELENAEGKLQSSALESDRPGRSFDRAGHGRHSLSSEQSAREHVEHAFAKRLADFLEKSRCENTYDQLILVAGPRLLGELRAALSTATQRLVRLEVNKEILPTERDLRSHLDGLAPL
jgi:protein required for attachment to host cells